MAAAKEVVPYRRLQLVFDGATTVAIIAVSVALVWSLSSDRPSKAAPVRPDPPLPTVPVSMSGAPVKGVLTAKVAILQYSDFQCPYCGTFAQATLPALDKHYLEPGKVVLVFRHLPLPRIHPFATKAAEAAECAGRQNRFWEMHDLLFANQKELDQPSLKRRAETLRLDVTQFDACLSGEAAQHVTRDTVEASQLSITGTPAFLIGLVQAGGQVQVKHRLAGAASFGEFQRVLEGLLAQANR